ncbi:DUF2125 domain-containing protein [Octadecabacter sp. G9-8]|uniref:DUF2125 domain-containing protein n=1 Tax=Octadecabacter dasysiphoniae TaxID=2909341 RepID=A0ABS9CWL6_9RHOB|nr:DUF2125 domain-containing protein [Octadecabacter dasysiphoniae]MCF2871346.1 DUF2125 domain-containing protein [Octadecabacter dasysiphoniae]
MKSIRHTSLIAAILCGTTANADVTAQQVWDNWTEQMAVYGQGFTTSGEDMSAGTLTISDVKIEMSDDEATITALLGDIALTENGDGTVSITVADSYPITINATPQYGDPVKANLTVSQENMSLTVSGDPEAMVYDIAADRYALSLDNLEGDQSMDVEVVDAVIAMLNVAGQYSVSEDTLTRIDYAFNIGALDIDMLFNEIDAGGTISGNADIADLAMFAKIAAPIDMDMNAEQPPFADGLAFEGGYTFGNLSYAFDFDVKNDQGSGSATVDSGILSVAFDMDGALYSGTSKGIDITMSIPNEIPFPLQASMAQYGFDFDIPLSQGTDGPRDARLGFNFTELAISDTIWNLVDPQTILPREAVTVAIGLSAKVTPFFDFLDPAQQEAAMMTDVPGELNSVEITELVVKGAGAEITGDGAFTFDNSDLQTFDGFPRPEGQVNFAINGVNGLIDNLIQMGLIPQEEAMMPRMMMGMFTTPVGDDMLTSTIEVNSEGHALANGQRLR